MIMRRNPQPFAASKIHSPGFTLVELLVVMAIIGVLVAITVPSVQAARESSRRTACGNNLRSLGLSLDLYHEQHNWYPLDGDHGFGIGAHLLPFLDQGALFEQLNPTRAQLPDPQHARPEMEGLPLDVFQCASAGEEPVLEDSRFGRSLYLGTSNLFSLRNNYEHIRDGESNTMAIADTLVNHAWALPRTGNAASAPNAGGDFSSRHPGGVQAVFCDGSVKFIEDSIAAELFSALCTIDGREVVSPH
jgi:prepilin-type N-terminal cleavage/methylation domain-containing protein/prepilin-type processing-associated H-X9-DG protein